VKARSWEFALKGEGGGMRMDKGLKLTLTKIGSNAAKSWRRGMPILIVKSSRGGDETLVTQGEPHY